MKIYAVVYSRFMVQDTYLKYFKEEFDAEYHKESLVESGEYEAEDLHIEDIEVF